MKTIGFVRSLKENENRIALLPADICRCKHSGQLFVEKGYGFLLGYDDEDYRGCGVHMVSRAQALRQDVICDPKVGDAEYLGALREQTVFGWLHAVQNREITHILLQNRLRGIAWEDMYDGGRHIFWKNNEIAGEAAVAHAYMLFGQLPKNTKVAVIGKGNAAMGAIRVLNFFGADVEVYDRRREGLLRRNLPQYDVIVNAVLWDTSRRDHIIYRDDLKRMKRGSLIVDISCDRHGGIESSVPTTIEHPIYFEQGVMHYVVDHTPSLFYKAISTTLSAIVTEYADRLIEGTPCDVLTKATVTQDGEILDPRISRFQNRTQ